MERLVQRAIRPAVPRDPLSLAAAAEWPSRAARDAAVDGLYVHVPFCAAPCPYCHFSKGRLSRGALERYLGALELEAAWRSPAAAGRTFRTVFLGGGSPSTLSARHFTRLVAALRGAFSIARDAEWTLEANPESTHPRLFDAWRAAGVNRLSFGVQSFEPADLRRLGRLHGDLQPARALAAARAHGFDRLSIDLMFGFPGHTLDAFERTLDRASELEVEHVSAYCYIAEAGTPMGDDVLADRIAAPDAAMHADAYAMATERLARTGLECYETSNFARPGAESRHNLVYWLRREWIALGPSAHGRWGGARWANAFSLTDWAEGCERGAPRDAERVLETPEDVADETLMLALRLSAGLDSADHSASTMELIEHRHGPGLNEALTQGRLERDGTRWFIAPRHRFLADEVIAWLFARARPLDSVSQRLLDSAGCPRPPYRVAAPSATPS